MKIIQIITEKENADLVLLGLGDDGCLYFLEKSDCFSKLMTDNYSSEYQIVKWRKIL